MAIIDERHKIWGIHDEMKISDYAKNGSLS